MNNNIFNGQPIYKSEDELYNFKNLINKNKNKKVVVNVFFKENEDYKISGIIENSGSDYIIISDPSSGKWNLIPMIYINFITFDEKIDFS